MDALAVDLADVAKCYSRRIHALQGIAVQIRPGEVFGLLGPNGAGKSTLVKIMMTLVRPTRASGTVLGQPIGHKPTLAKVGYMPEQLRFPHYLTGRQALGFFAALSKVDRPTRQRRSAELLDLVGLAGRADTRIGTYSKGMQQRLALAQAMVHDPQLLVLDEPTDGLDPVGRKEVRDILQKLRNQGKTVLLNSHMLGEVERICDRVGILVGGKVVQLGTVEELTAGSQRYEIELGGAAPGKLREEIRKALPCAKPLIPVTGTPSSTWKTDGPPERGTLTSGETVELTGNIIRILTVDPARVQPVIDALRRQGLMVLSMRPVRQSLEDFFIQAVGNRAGEEPGMAEVV